MNVLKIGFGFVLAYPIHEAMFPAWVGSIPERHMTYLHYINPTYAEIAGISLIPSMLFVVACVGLGLIAACVFYQTMHALFNGIYVSGKSNPKREAITDLNP